MSNDDEIKPGDRFERVGPGAWGVNHGDVCTALRPAGNGYNGWFVRGSNTIMYLGNPALWRRLPRTDAPAVKVGDIVRDQEVLDALPGEAVLQWGNGDAATWRRSDCRAAYSRGFLLEFGVRIVALPEPPKVEAVEPPPPRCAPGCTPKEPCRTAGVCPAWRELRISRDMRDKRQGIPDALPPARASTYQPRCAELSGWGSWNGRAGK